MKKILFVLLLFAGTATIMAAPASALAFSPDGSMLVSGGHESIQLRSPEDASVQESVPCDLARIRALAFNPSGTVLAVAGGTPGENGMALLLDWESQQVLHRLTNFSDLVTTAAFSPDGHLLALGSADCSVQIFRGDSGWNPPVEQSKLAGHTGPVLALAFSPGQNFILTASADRSLKIWSAADSTLHRSFSHHTDILFALSIRPAERGRDPSLFQCASGSADRTVRVWQPAIGRMVRIIRGHKRAIFALAYSPDGTHLYSAGEEGIVRRIDGDSDRILHSWKAHEDAIYSLAMSPDGKTLATGAWDGEVRPWPLEGNPGGLQQREE